MARPIRLTVHGSILLVILVALGIMAAGPARRAFEQNREIKREEMKLNALRVENEKLERKLQRLDDPEYIEKLAREELGLVRPGEISYVIVPGPTQTVTAEAEPGSAKPWYKRIGDWFRDRVS